MRNLERRIQRIEALVNEEEGLTEQDVELVLSCLPKEMADAALDGLFGAEHLPPERQGNSPKKSGLHGKTLENILGVLPCEVAELLKSRLIL